MKRGWYLMTGILCWNLTVAPFGSCSTGSGGGADDPAPQADANTVCSLSDEQQTAAPKAFAVMTPTFQHPRCINCHGQVNPYTGDNHGGGNIQKTTIKGWVEHVDNGLEPVHDVVHPEFTRYFCDACHVDSSRANEQGTGWRLPDRSFSFVGKDSIQLCKQMKQMGSAEQFIEHITKDIIETHFIEIAFQGTRGLSAEGQKYYVGMFATKFEPEPPPISHSTFISQGQTWVDAMGGKFRGDNDCGCVPHHYSLSADMKSVQDAHAGSFHTELSGHTEIPLKFKEDGSFKGEAPMPVTQAGYMHAGNTDCKMSGNIAMKMEVEGTVDDAKPVLHLVVSNGTTGGSVTTTCNGGIAGSHPYPSKPNPPGTNWDIPSLIGVDQYVPMPYQKPPEFTSSLKLRINQTE